MVLHALTDALLGALCDGDIGVHFPPSDPQWRGASSDRFLAFAAERVRASGGVIDHLDVTVLCERPRIGPYRDAIRERIAAVATVPLGSVSIKATTTERLGFTGRGEGLRRKQWRPSACLSAKHDRGPALLERAAGLIRSYEARGWTVAAAESCTGGLVAALLTEVPGSSAVVERGFVTYSNQAKAEMLGVPDDLIAAHGAVSAPVARAMAEGALQRSTADVAVAITGVAGPGGGTAAKPIGLVHFGMAMKNRPTLHKNAAMATSGARRCAPAPVEDALSLLEQALAESRT